MNEGKGPGSGDALVDSAVDPAAAPLAALSSAASLDDMLETIVVWASNVVGGEDIIRASEEFYNLTGKVFHGDTFYDRRMNLFQDFYLFEREAEGATPFAILSTAIDRLPIDEQIKARIRLLADHRHSLFEILKVKPQLLVVRDLAVGDKLKIAAKPGEEFDGFSKKELFQGFLFRLGQSWSMSCGILVHPLRATKVIKSAFRKKRKSPTFDVRSEVYRLARQQVRYLRHQHVDARTIYLADPR